jgi:hypothetical protein
MSDAVAVHPDGLWRDRADFVLGARLDDVPGHPDAWEQLWARRVGDFFEICCIPFFAYDLALGDVVAIDEDLRITGVRASGGHRTFRLTLDGQPPEQREQVHADLHAMGAGFECRGGLMAVDAGDDAVAEGVWALLVSLHDAHGVAIEGPFSGSV